jgi:hypothetical protein
LREAGAGVIWRLALVRVGQSLSTPEGLALAGKSASLFAVPIIQRVHVRRTVGMLQPTDEVFPGASEDAPERVQTQIVRAAVAQAKVAPRAVAGECGGVQ